MIGGNTLFDGYAERMYDFNTIFFLNIFREKDLRPYIDTYLNFQVKKLEDPIVYPWQCASKLISQSVNSFNANFVSKADYAEFGSNICRRKFENYFDVL